MNILNPFATFNLAAVADKYRAQILLAVGAQSFVIAGLGEVERVREALTSLGKTDRTRLGVARLRQPGEAVKMLSHGPYAGHAGVLVGQPPEADPGGDFWLRLVEADGRLGQPVSASPDWWSTCGPVAGQESGPMAAVYDLRVFETGSLVLSVKRALSGAAPGDVLVFDSPERREQAAGVIAGEGRGDVRTAFAPHSHGAPALITDGLLLGSAGVFLGYADDSYTAVVNVEGYGTRLIPVGSYFILNGFPLANCTDDELLALLSGPRPHEFKFDSCGGCRAQGFRIAGGPGWHCPLCNHFNGEYAGSRLHSPGERIDFGPTPEQFAAVGEMIERRAAFPEDWKVARVVEVRERRGPGEGDARYSVGMFMAVGEEAPDQIALDAGHTCYATTPGGGGGLWLGRLGQTREEAVEAVLRMLGRRYVERARQGLSPWPAEEAAAAAPVVEFIEREEAYEPEVFVSKPSPEDVEEMWRAVAAYNRSRNYPFEELPALSELRVSLVKNVIDEEGQVNNPRLLVPAVAGVEVVESGMYILVPRAFPPECDVQVTGEGAYALAAVGEERHSFITWPSVTVGSAEGKYEGNREALSGKSSRIAKVVRDRAPRPGAVPEAAVVECAGRRVFDIADASDFYASLREALARAQAGDAVVVWNSEDQKDAFRELREAGRGEEVTVAVRYSLPPGTPITVLKDKYEGRAAFLVGGSGEARHVFAVLDGGETLKLHRREWEQGTFVAESRDI